MELKLRLRELSNCKYKHTRLGRHSPSFAEKAVIAIDQPPMLRDSRVRRYSLISSKNGRNDSAPAPNQTSG